MKPYAALTELGQARRLRLVSNDFNGIFRVDTTDGQKFILRVTLPEGGHDLNHVRILHNDLHQWNVRIPVPKLCGFAASLPGRLHPPQPLAGTPPR